MIATTRSVARPKARLSSIIRRAFAGATVVGLVATGLMAGASVANAAGVIGAPGTKSTPAGITSVAATAGKAQGSGLWGYAGDVATKSPTGTTFTYGLAVSPTDGSLWVTDSAKVIYKGSGFAGLLFPSLCGAFPDVVYSNTNASDSTSCYAGSSRLMHFGLNATPDWSLGQYGGNGTYGAVPAGNNAGLGANYDTLSAAYVADGTGTANGEFGGARGVSVMADGSAWVLDSDAGLGYVSNTKTPLRHFSADDTELTGVGTGIDFVWGNRFNGQMQEYPVGAARLANGDFVVTTVVSELLKQYRPDGTFVRNIYLRQPAGTSQTGDAGYRSPNAVAVDPASGDLLVGYINPGSGQKSFIERIDPTVCTAHASGNYSTCALKATLGVGNLAAGSSSSTGAAAVTFALAVEPVTGDIYIGQTSGLITVLSSAGALKGKFTAFGNGSGNGQLNTVRNIAFDARGFLYATTGEGTAGTRVQIFARTPDPVTGLTAVYTDASRTSATLTWDALALGTTAISQSPLRDYVVEKSEDGGATWTVVPTSTSTDATATVAGLTGTAGTQFRVAAWNEAGNGDWMAATATDAPSRITVVKTGAGVETATADDAVQVDADSTVDFSYTVTNEGPSAVTGITLVDSVLGTLTAPAGFTGSLAPNTSVTFIASGPVAAGAYQNRVTATGVSQGANVSADDTWFGFGVTRGISLTKTGNGEIAETAADRVDVPAGANVAFAYTVRNDGNVPVSNVSVTDDRIATLTAPPGFTGTLGVGQSVIFTATGPVAAGAYVNVADASGTAAGQPVDADAAWHGFGIATDLSVLKTGNGIAAASASNAVQVGAGSDVDFAYVITNGGNAEITLDEVRDDVLGVLTAPAGFSGTLAAGASVTFTATGPVAAGAYSNTVTVSATASGTAQKLTADDAWFGFGVVGGLEVIKTGAGERHADAADAMLVPAGSEVTFDYRVTNTSNVDLVVTNIVDSVLGPVPAPAGFSGTLAPNESVTYTLAGVVDAGAYRNTVAVTGVAGPVTATGNDEWNGFGETAALSVIKRGDGVRAATADERHAVTAGSTVTFTYVITNQGNTAVALGDVVDDKIGTLTAPAGFSGTLAAGASVTFSATGPVAAGDYENTVSVSGESAAGAKVSAEDSWFGLGQKKDVPTNPPTPTDEPTTHTPTPDSSTDPTSEPGDSPSAGPDELSRTGASSMGGWLMGGLLVSALGVGLLIARRRTAR